MFKIVRLKFQNLQLSFQNFTTPIAKVTSQIAKFTTECSKFCLGGCGTPHTPPSSRPWSYRCILNFHSSNCPQNVVKIKGMSFLT